ncbi:DNA internalization-related competence protein ComEC/Rec2 [Bacillus salacetis]|uniref:DNA internalization-related competence protein ComEC/Rec2 n=1 Tax=Bacillus salacetis TaxID=2315464 RepID=UPI003B9E3392
MKKNQFVYFALSYLTGTSLALHIKWGAFFLSVFILILLVRQLPGTTLLIALLLLPASFCLSLFQMDKQATVLTPFQTDFSVVFKERPQIDGDLLMGTAETIQGEAVIFRYKIPDENEKKKLVKWHYTGLTCNVSGELLEPGQARNMYSFDYRQYLLDKNIFWLLEVDSLEERQCSYKDKSIFEKLAGWREEGIQSIQAHFPEQSAGIAAALVFGHRDLIKGETLEAYQRLGVIHLLAISGLHVGMLFAVLYYLLLRIGLAREHVQILLLIILPLYVLLTGAAPPVIRAAGIMAAVIAAGFVRLRLSAADAVSLVFLLYLFLDPFALKNIGFQLSFLVSFSLILSSHRILTAVQQKWKLIFMVTGVCQICSIPALLWHFYEFSLIGFVVNSMYVPFFTVILLPLSLLSFFAMLFFPPAADLLFPLIQLAVTFADYLSGRLNSLPFITFTAGKPPLLLAFLYILSVGFFFTKAEKAKWPTALAPLFIILSLHKISFIFNPFGELIVADVGQGDCIIIDLPFHEGVYMIDTGGVIRFPQEKWQERSEEFSLSSDVLSPLLKSKGIRRIDKLILTHSDFDHAGAALELIDEIKIGEILISPGSQESDIFQGLLEKAEKRKVDVRETGAGEKWSTNNADFLFLYPFDDHYEGNNDSLVLFGEFGGKRWLFTGDLEEGGEKELMERWKVKADVLKVGHHGSITSTSDLFLTELDPDTALISAGKNNRYGHPDPEIVNRLKQKGIKIYNTAEMGAVHYKFLGSRGTFRTVIP